jgi:transposase
MASSPRKYTAEFKQRAVQLWRESGTTYAEVARGLGIDESTLRGWVKKADAAGAAGGGEPAGPFQMEEELKRLRRENAQLRRDNEILLKASAFFASRNL